MVQLAREWKQEGLKEGEPATTKQSEAPVAAVVAPAVITTSQRPQANKSGSTKKPCEYCSKQGLPSGHPTELCWSDPKSAHYREDIAKRRADMRKNRQNLVVDGDEIL